MWISAWIVAVSDDLSRRYGIEGMDFDVRIGGGRNDEGEGVSGCVETDVGTESGVVNLEFVEGILEILEFWCSGK